jgi:hypothetical protein
MDKIITQEHPLEDMAEWQKQINAIQRLCNDAEMPVTKGKMTLTLAERVAWMTALLASYRTTQAKIWVEGVK